MSHNPTRIYRRDAYVHGSAQWASREHLKSRNYGDNGRMLLGYGPPEHPKMGQYPITTSSKAHGIAVGTTRSGKLISSTSIVYLSHLGSLVGCAPKNGEEVKIAARFRRDVLGQWVFVIDADDCAASDIGFPICGFNPIEWLDPKSPDFFDDSFAIAEGFVISNAKDPFWSDEARMLITGLIMHVKTCPEDLLPNQQEGRTLGQVRDCLNLPPKQFKGLVSGIFDTDEDDNPILIQKGMAQSKNRYVRAAAGRIQNKAAKELSGVISTAQANTHLLERPTIRQVLSRNDFHPDMLADGNTTVILATSAAKLSDDNRFHRLFINCVLRKVSRFKEKPKLPIQFVLEEFGTALGYLSTVEVAFGLMAGYGVKLLIILQDLNQLAKHYENWQTFIGNCGYIQASGVNDMFTAEYLCKLCGTTTTEFLSATSAAVRGSLLGDPDYFSSEDQFYSRPLITPDELRVLHPSMMLLILAGSYPVICYKTVYFLDQNFRDNRGNPLYDQHPDYAHLPVPNPVDFTKRGLDIPALLESVFYQV